MKGSMDKAKTRIMIWSYLHPDKVIDEEEETDGVQLDALKHLLDYSCTLSS
jgi:hypothetical protein